MYRLRSLCASSSLRAIDPRFSNGLAWYGETPDQDGFNYALSEFEENLSNRTILEHRITGIVDLAKLLWKNHHAATQQNATIKLQIVDALNAANIVIREAIDNDVLYMLLRYYLVSLPW